MRRDLATAVPNHILARIGLKFRIFGVAGSKGSPMNGTNHSTAGLRRVTRWDAPIQLRLVAFCVILALGALLIVWMKTSTWRQVAELHQEFAGIESDRFHWAVHVMGDIRSLNDTFLACHLHPTRECRERFLNQTQQLKQRLAEQTGKLRTANESAAFKDVQAAYDRYLSGAEEALSAAAQPPGSFANLYTDIQTKTQPLLSAANRFLDAQNEALTQLLRESEQTLLHLQSLLKQSLLVVLAIAALLVVLGYRGMITPLRSRLNESQAVIERQEKLASLGVLAAGVAHEIRNPLTAIKFRLFSLKKALPTVSGNEDARIIGGEIDRLDRIVTDFLQFARPSEPERIGVPGERIFQEVCELLQSDLQKQSIDLRMDCPGTTWVEADPQQIKQVLINLVQNSAESIGRDGAITLRTREGNGSLAGAHRSAVILEVTDTGRGIAPEVEKRLFDPFFTTKEGGTGLGLAIAARIVEKHHGILRYRTKVNHGTTFEIVLPKLEANAT